MEQVTHTHTHPHSASLTQDAHILNYPPLHRPSARESVMQSKNQSVFSLITWTPWWPHFWGCKSHSRDASLCAPCESMNTESKYSRFMLQGLHLGKEGSLTLVRMKRRVMNSELSVLDGTSSSFWTKAFTEGHSSHFPMFQGHRPTLSFHCRSMHRSNNIF